MIFFSFSLLFCKLIQCAVLHAYVTCMLLYPLFMLLWLLCCYSCSVLADDTYEKVSGFSVMLLLMMYLVCEPVKEVNIYISIHNICGLNSIFGCIALYAKE